MLLSKGMIWRNGYVAVFPWHYSTCLQRKWNASRIWDACGKCSCRQQQKRKAQGLEWEVRTRFLSILGPSFCHSEWTQGRALFPPASDLWWISISTTMLSWCFQKFFQPAFYFCVHEKFLNRTRDPDWALTAEGCITKKRAVKGKQGPCGSPVLAATARGDAGSFLPEICGWVGCSHLFGLPIQFITPLSAFWASIWFKDKALTHQDLSSQMEPAMSRFSYLIKSCLIATKWCFCWLI